MWADSMTGTCVTTVRLVRTAHRILTIACVPMAGSLQRTVQTYSIPMGFAWNVARLRGIASARNRTSFTLAHTGLASDMKGTRILDGQVDWESPEFGGNVHIANDGSFVPDRHDDREYPDGRES